MIQEIGGKTDLPDGDQTGHHIRSQCGESVFLSIEDCSLGGGDEDFEDMKKVPERGLSI